MPLQRRLPKFGFKNPFRVEYTVLNLSDLQALYERYNSVDITPEHLVAWGVIRMRDNVKILAKGELSVKLNVEADAFSEAARKAIEALGGTAKTL